MELIRKELYKDKESWGWRGNKKTASRNFCLLFLFDVIPYAPKLSYMIFSGCTPRLSSIFIADDVIIGGPHK
jgi:hypothetical protein